MSCWVMKYLEAIPWTTSTILDPQTTAIGLVIGGFQAGQREARLGTRGAFESARLELLDDHWNWEKV